MVVFSMDSKRPRRPNVRLWEVGDLSAAFTCGISHGTNARLGQKKLKRNSSHVEESEYLRVSTQKQPECAILDPDVSPTVFEDIQHNTENKDPNSVKIVSECANSEELNMSKCKLDFGTITRRSRIMKRKRWNPNRACSLFVDPWNSKAGPIQRRTEDEKCNEWYPGVGCTSAAGFSIHHIKGDKDCSETETSSMSKEAYETEGAWYEEDTTFPQPTFGHNKEGTSDGNVNTVSEWLEELGFGKFAKLFEMHEVDKETLPLLTFEDLKDMGIVAVGPCRKLFTAIQQLRGGR
ncbi:hypothetical protein ACH5RR_025122 [Cinchona calisaya]|uniref:SAM domain-containing protein n=1 Tax=Cinchona calisaya TaxID=153742 RepID=A0ABD2YYR0_9GENT